MKGQGQIKIEFLPKLTRHLLRFVLLGGLMALHHQLQLF